MFPVGFRQIKPLWTALCPSIRYRGLIQQRSTAIGRYRGTLIPTSTPGPRERLDAVQSRCHGRGLTEQSLRQQEGSARLSNCAPASRTTTCADAFRASNRSLCRFSATAPTNCRQGGRASRSEIAG